MTLDDVPNDGEAGDGANVHSDVEDLSGTDGDDVLIGSAAANELDGGDGADTLDGRGGLDLFTLGAGDDTALARDGLGERIVCGDGADTVTGDDIDDLGGCESAALSGELVRDLDHDGISKPEDCNDADPAIRPGAVDALNDGVDQDCDGADAIDRDRDRDGVAIPFDCDDGNARAAPGKREIFGNKVDEDCNGRADPLQTITTPVRARFIAAPGAARIVRLQVIGATRGTRVQVRCKRPRLPLQAAQAQAGADDAEARPAQALRPAPPREPDDRDPAAAQRLDRPRRALRRQRRRHPVDADPLPHAGQEEAAQLLSAGP